MRTRDGVELRGTDPAAIVRELHSMSRSQCATDAEFRFQMSGRTMTQVGKRVRCDSDENFVADLVEVGILIDD